MPELECATFPVTLPASVCSADAPLGHETLATARRGQNPVKMAKEKQPLSKAADAAWRQSQRQLALDSKLYG